MSHCSAQGNHNVYRLKSELFRALFCFYIAHVPVIVTCHLYMPQWAQTKLAMVPNFHKRFLVSSHLEETVGQKIQEAENAPHTEPSAVVCCSEPKVHLKKKTLIKMLWLLSITPPSTGTLHNGRLMFYDWCLRMVKCLQQWSSSASKIQVK